MEPVEPSLVLFDGVCNLCNSSVQFILKRDPFKKFRFASLQSETGRRWLAKMGLPADSLDTLVLIENDKAYTRSTAALKIARHLSGLWPLFYGLIVLPAFFRDALYRCVARNRYRWFGKKEACPLPKPEWKDRFLESS